MKNLQHPLGVEVEVTQLLQANLVPHLCNFDWESYLSWSKGPNEYSSAEVFKKEYAYFSLLRKWKGVKTCVSPSAEALVTWMKSEKKCFETNRRLHMESSTGKYSVAPSAIIAAQRKVQTILGRLNVQFISELCRFGNGATYDLRRGATHSEKSCRPSITFDAIPLACQVLTGDRYMASLVGPFRNLKIVRANRMVMVPKNFKTDRPIAAEPTLNSYIQQGFGRYFRLRLKKFGVDLDDQTINQDLASKARLLGLSTLDLSSASDTLCINLVKLLLPREWYEALNSIRSANTEYKGRSYHLSKFSSMGNAYTFELESLIFYALCSSVSDRDVSVYGDDIVVSNEDELHVREILTWAGFDVNIDKSFGEGSRFYESCGKHYFDDEEVTPCYQKDVCSRPHDYVRFHNRLVRAGIRLNLRKEFLVASQLVRERCQQRFGRSSPGIGPLVEYDEYFIKEDYVWTGPYVDSVRIRSAVTVPITRKSDGRRDHLFYFARKLRNPSFLSPASDGQVAESVGSKLLVREKHHWRSSVLN
jgi:hypothetical protein